MPLMKLWNSIFGRSTSVEKSAGRAQDQPVPSSKSLAAAASGKSQAAEPDSQKMAISEQRRGRVRASKGTRLSLFGGGRQHGTLCKLVKPLQAAIVLEISVGDGSRAVEVLETLRTPGTVRYVAIDQFEMAGGDTTLKAFHQKLRTNGIRPQVFPEPIDRGLVRVGNTVGTVDLVIIAAESSGWQTPEILSLLARVLHDQTVVLYREEESWDRYERRTAGSHRRAA